MLKGIPKNPEQSGLFFFSNPEIFGIHILSFGHLLAQLVVRLTGNASPPHIFSPLFQSIAHSRHIRCSHKTTYLNTSHPANVVPVSSGLVRGSKRINCFAIQHPSILNFQASRSLSIYRVALFAFALHVLRELVFIVQLY